MEGIISFRKIRFPTLKVVNPCSINSSTDIVMLYVCVQHNFTSGLVQIKFNDVVHTRVVKVNISNENNLYKDDTVIMNNEHNKNTCKK